MDIFGSKKSRVKSEGVAEFIPTRQSLLSRLRDWNDQESWKLFFDTYWRLIYKSATRAGLSNAEAQDAVQETVVSVMKSMPEFRYDPKKGSFKSWLMQVTKWRINDQFRKRQREIQHKFDDHATDLLDSIPDENGCKLEANWDEEWEQNQAEVVIERVKQKVDPAHYQIFDLYVFKQWPVLKIATSLRISPATVYVAKHRIGKIIKQELKKLNSELPGTT